MKNKTVTQYAETFGFIPVNTGGNCTALERQISKQIYILITDDCDMPKSINDSVVMGIYCENLECVFYTVMEARFAFLMGEKIAKAINAYSIDQKPTFELGAIVSWLETNNLDINNSWNDIKKTITKEVTE